MPAAHQRESQQRGNLSDTPQIKSCILSRATSNSRRTAAGVLPWRNVSQLAPSSGLSQHSECREVAEALGRSLLGSGVFQSLATARFEDEILLRRCHGISRQPIMLSAHAYRHTKFSGRELGQGQRLLCCSTKLLPLASAS